jgi:hypothetical protein
MKFSQRVGLEPVVRQAPNQLIGLATSRGNPMLKGTVSFVAKIKGNGISFPLTEFIPNEPGVDKVEIEGPNGDEIRSTVHVNAVATQDEGRALAAKVNTATLDRLAFFHATAIEKARITGDQFTPVTPPPGAHLIAATGYLVLSGGEARPVLGIPPAHIKAELEQASPPGESTFGLFRSARQSESPVEEFMHLYNALLMLYNDSQADVDAFIVGEDPAVPQRQHPRKPPGVMETVYTRLRNELAHQRAGVSLDNTKAEMVNRLGGLIAVTKRAIELHL